jgi:hypothetical protein
VFPPPRGQTLASNGFEVTLLYTLGREVETATVEFWVQYYSSHGIKFVPLPTSPTPYDVPIDIEISHRVYIWLSQQAPYDAIHFPDNRGRAYFTLVAKRQGINFGRSRVVLHAHSPHLWYKMNSLQVRCVAALDARVPCRCRKLPIKASHRKKQRVGLSRLPACVRAAVSCLNSLGSVAKALRAL